MKIPRQIIRGCRVALLTGILLLLANALWHPFEPRYNGKRLSVWAKLLSNQPGHDDGDDQWDPVAAHAEAVAAIRHLSTRAWPLAVRYCGARDGPFIERIKDWVNEQKVFAIHLPSDSDYRQMGVSIFEALGPAGEPAVLPLINLFRVGDANVATAASMSLVHIGRGSIPLLTAALTNLNPQVREWAAYTLAGFETQADNASPLLLNLLKDNHAHVRRAAAWALGLVTTNSDAVVQALLAGLKDADSGGRGSAAMSLGHLRANPEQTVPALLHCIAAETNLPSPAMISAIACFGTNARPWLPVLVEMIESNRFGFYSISALNALKRIDPEAADTLIERCEFIRTNLPGAVH